MADDTADDVSKRRTKNILMRMAIRICDVPYTHSSLPILFTAPVHANNNI